MSDRFACRILIGGEVKDLQTLINAIIDARVWPTDEPEAALTKEDDVVSEIKKAVAAKLPLSLDDYEARYGKPGDLPETCAALGLDYDWLSDSYGGDPASIERLRGGERTYLECGYFGHPVVGVEEVLEAIGRTEKRGGSKAKRNKLRKELLVPPLKPITVAAWATKE